MTRRQQGIAWIAIGAFALLFLTLFQEILLPFVAGMAIAYLLDPLADRLEAVKFPRWLATTTVLLLFVGLAVAVVLLILPLIQSQIEGLVVLAPSITAALQNLFVTVTTYAEASFAPEDIDRVRAAVSSYVGSALSFVAGIVKRLLGSGLAFINFLGLVFVTPIVAFYLLRDWDRIVAYVDGLLPREHAGVIREQVREVDLTLAGFVRGQSSVCFVLGLAYGLALSAAGLQFGFTIGVISGLVSFIPYFGSIFGFVASVGLALLQFDEFYRVAIVGLIFVIGQVVEGNFLTPKLVGDRVGLHPVWVIFALFAGGDLLGFVGMLIALPVAATLGVLIRFTIAQYRESRLYGDDVDGQGAGSDGDGSKDG